MSAWLVSKYHIDKIVSTALAWTPGMTFEDATLLGRTLWTENLKSVAYRYPDDGDGERRGPNGLTDKEITGYVYQLPEDEPLSPDEMLKALDCLDYQSCKHPGWKRSEARKMLLALHRNAKARGATDTSAAYDKAPWRFDERRVNA